MSWRTGSESLDIGLGDVFKIGADTRIDFVAWCWLIGSLCWQPGIREHHLGALTVIIRPS